MRLLKLLLFFFFCCDGFAQDSTGLQKSTDSGMITPVTVIQKDSLPLVATAAVPSIDSCRSYILQQLVKLNLFAKSEFFIEKEKITAKKEWLFYYILGLVLLFGLLRIMYMRYFNDLFRVFFRTSLRVNQIREQLVQSGLQSLLFNLFFAVSTGTYVYLLASFFNVSVQVPELLIPLIASGIIAILYLGKFVFLQLSGWLFSMRSATDTYSFIVFLINKIIGVIILPFVVVIAFAHNQLAAVAITVSLALIVGLFLYRFLRAYSPVQAELKVGRFHFFIFFIAFEIAPLMLLYKLFLNFL